jgi:hypothetical protein
MFDISKICCWGSRAKKHGSAFVGNSGMGSWQKQAKQ